MKMVTVLKNGVKVTADYADICHELGFTPDSNFVEIKRGAIGWTAGKKHEILALKRACEIHGYKLSKGLREFNG